MQSQWWINRLPSIPGKNMMLLKKNIKCKDGTIQTQFYLSKCKYCGKLFIKFQNKTLYCSQECKCKSTQDNKAKYQRKRRKSIREGHLISNETEKLGTTYFPKKIGSWIEEQRRIKYAKRKAGII